MYVTMHGWIKLLLGCSFLERRATVARFKDRCGQVRLFLESTLDEIIYRG